MLRRTKSSSLLPIVRLTNYFYPEDKESSQVTSMEIYSTQAAHSARQGTLTPPPDYEQLYQAMQLDTLNEEDRVRRKYACQGLSLGVIVRGLYSRGALSLFCGMLRW